VTGSPEAPRAAGELALADGRLELVGTGVTYEDVQGRLRMAGDSAQLALHARAGDGTLEGSGRIDVGGAPAALGLRFVLHDLPVVRRPALEAALGGTLGVSGSLGAPDVHGTLDVARALLRPTTLPSASAPAARDPTITVVGPPVEEVDTRVDTADLGGPVRLAIDLPLGRRVRIRQADASIDLGGALRLDKAPGGPVRLHGHVLLLRGWYMFAGRRFTIERGTIELPGATDAQPILDVTAAYRAAAHRILVHVEGTAERPALHLSSEPPLEQADIRAVLLFGKPPAELGRGESQGLQQQAVSVAAGYLAPELQASVMKQLGVDTLVVELPQEGGSPGQVSVGRYVTDDVLLSLAQEFGSRAGEVVSVEYGLTRALSIRGSTSTRGSSAVHIFWRRRY
jgi:translocation and assembly module TamB